MIRRDRFGEKEWQTSVSYHLNGLVEAANKVEELAGRLDATWGARGRATQRLLADLETELFHLSFHEKELRRPYQRLVEMYYADSSGEGSRKRPKELRTSLSAKRARKRQ